MAGGSQHANNSVVTKFTFLLNNSNSLSPNFKRIGLILISVHANTEASQQNGGLDCDRSQA